MVIAVLTVLLAGVFLAAGVPKVARKGAVIGNLRRLGVGDGSIRLIGVLEIAAALGLALGVRYSPLAIAAGTGLTLLLAGAVGHHVRSGDFRNARNRGHAVVPVVLGLVVFTTTMVRLVS